MADLQITDPVLLARILNLGENKQYPAMYQLIADSIQSGAIAVLGGVNSKMYYWYDQAENINADIKTSLSTQFIREVAAGGQRSGQGLQRRRQHRLFAKQCCAGSAARRGGAGQFGRCAGVG